MTLAFEAPIMNLEKLLFSSHAKEKAPKNVYNVTDDQEKQ